MICHFLTAIKVRSNCILQVKDVRIFLGCFIIVKSFVWSETSDRGKNKVVDKSQTLYFNIIFFHRKISGTLTGNNRADSESCSVIFFG